MSTENKKYVSMLNDVWVKDKEARDRIEALENRCFVKAFKITDFTQVAKTQKYYIRIPASEHKLTNPFVEKVILSKTSESEETNNYMTATVCGTRLLSTGTIKVYVTIDLTKYTEYTGKIYLQGELTNGNY